MADNKQGLEDFFASFAGKDQENPWTTVVAMWRQIRAGGASWTEAVHIFVALMADQRQQQRERDEVQ